MCSRLETLIKADLSSLPAVLIKITNYFHVSISGSSFDAWTFDGIEKKKTDWFWESCEKINVL